jgi:hypothetical protein
MESFRTVGWFGPECPAQNVFYVPFPPKYMEIYDSKTGSNPIFPLEMAMKIFWESEEIKINASMVWKRLTLSLVTQTFTSNFNDTIKWGSINFDSFEEPEEREFVETAKEMLCYIKNNSTSQSNHTIMQRAPNPNNQYYFNILNRPYIYKENPSLKDYKLYAPIDFFLTAGAGFARLLSHDFYGTISGSVPQMTMGNAQILSPWGNTEVPILIPPPTIDSDGTITSFIESVSISIEFTAADPDVRYA